MSWTLSIKIGFYNELITPCEVEVQANQNTYRNTSGYVSCFELDGKIVNQSEFEPFTEIPPIRL